MLAQRRLGGGRIHHAMRTVAQVKLAFDMMCERALSRESHGKVIAEHQMVQEAIADSYAEINMLRLLVLWTAWTIDNSSTQEARTQIAACKYTCAKVLREVSYRALHIMGSLGTTEPDAAAGHVGRRADDGDRRRRRRGAQGDGGPQRAQGLRAAPGPVADRVHPGQARGGAEEVREPDRVRPGPRRLGRRCRPRDRKGLRRMEITGKVAVVTGGASGVGRSLCLGLAERGAAGVVVCDIDAEGAAKVAAEIEAGRSSRHRGTRPTCRRRQTCQALVARTEEAFGPVDLFFSNAGIIVAGGAEASDEAWSRIWAINVQSHVYVARAVLPGMLARGEGYLVITASAAGLLTQLGSAPYAVTKHAAVAFAEWLSITHGDQGIRVSCLCPQAFTSNLLSTSRREVGAGADAGGRHGRADRRRPRSTAC